MKYTDYKNARQQEFDSLPLFFAFSNHQFKEAMENRGLTENDTDQVYSLGMGAYYLRKDADVIRAYFDKPDGLKTLMEEDPGFAEDAFEYELANHEYFINWEGDYDVCSCFGDCKWDERKTYKDYLKEMGYGEATIRAFTSAVTKLEATWVY